MVGLLIIANFKTLSKKIRIPITKMEKFSTELAAGNLQAQISTPEIMEFSHLVENLNSMALQIDRLMKQNIEESINLQKEEMAKLQAQITPHFLYNTFDTIIWLAEAKKTDEVIEITRAFSNFMRISLSRGHDWITIEQEIEHVKNYLTIQKVRYGDILNYEFFVDERINNFMILKLSLQPLIENAIYHGIKNKIL
jgi:two-component system sensor histidine kinase YesM